MTKRLDCRTQQKTLTRSANGQGYMTENVITTVRSSVYIIVKELIVPYNIIVVVQIVLTYISF